MEAVGKNRAGRRRIVCGGIISSTRSDKASVKSIVIYIVFTIHLHSLNTDFNVYRYCKVDPITL